MPPHLGIYVSSPSSTWSGGTHHRGRHVDRGVRSKPLPGRACQLLIEGLKKGH